MHKKPYLKNVCMFSTWRNGGPSMAWLDRQINFAAQVYDRN
jgi:hypothetical protein